MQLKSTLQLLLSSSPAIGSLLTDSSSQHPLDTPALDKAPSYRSDLLALHKQLVEIPSTSGQEHDAGKFLVDYFTSKSWHYETQPVAARGNTPAGTERFNVVAWPPSSSSSSSTTTNKRNPSPKVLVTSHYDCVPPHIPYSITPGPVTANTTIAGRCTVDAKGSIAAQLTAVHELLASGELAPEDVQVLYVVGEEVSGDGMRAFSAANEIAFRAGVFGEPTELKLACGHKGALRCDVQAKGRAGHSGYPWIAKSATEVLMRGLVEVLDAELGSSERYGNTTVNVGLLEGGVALNVIPAHANASLLLRIALEPQETGHEVVKERVIETLKAVDSEALIVDCPVGQGATHCDCDVNGFDTVVANYGTDIPHLKGDHKRYLYGPGTILVAHGDDEALTVADLEDAVEGNKKLILHGLTQ